MTRKRISLDGNWDFQHDPHSQQAREAVLSGGEWRSAVVPMPWQAQFEDLRNASGTGWYRRTITLDQPPQEAAYLHFSAVNYFAWVWVNGQLAGEHEGGYLPFELDVTHLLRPGDNELVVQAIAPGADPLRWPEFPFSEVPHGKQSWYMPVGGIWQSAWLELRPALHLHGLYLTPNAETGQVEVVVKLQGQGVDADGTSAGEVVELRISDPDGAELVRGQVPPARPHTLSVDPAAIRRWSPETPHLYQAQAVLLRDGQMVDEISSHFGFRTVEIRDKRIYLNGQPVYLRGALDQAYYPELVYTTPDDAYLEDQARKAKELGLNCLRTHIKVEDPRYYDVADRLGLLIWTEIPNWVHLSQEAAWRAKDTFAGMVERDWNHPSIICWSLVNENWGTDLVNNPEHRAWLEQFYREAKAIDPTRLVVDNSVCYNNLHVASDLDDVHEYRAIPDHAEQWDRWVAQCANRLEWAWAEEYRHNRRPELPILVSEFGNWGLPDPERILEQGREPWWFETGYNFGEGIVYPHGMRQRYDESSLPSVFDSFEDFIRHSQEHMARSLAYEISSMRLYPDIGGYVVTEFTDVHWECNGLMTMQREVKAGLDRYFVPINQDRVVVLRPRRWSGRPGEALPVDIRCMDESGPAEAGRVRWQAGPAQGELAAPGGLVDIPLPQGDESQMVTIEAQWLDGEGRPLAENRVEVACLAPTAPSGPVYVENDPALADALQAQCYSLANQPGQGTLTIARLFTEDLRARVQAGERVLLILSPDSRQQPGAVSLPFLWIAPRTGTAWQGDWATSFSWLRKSGPFAHLPGSPMLEMEYAEIMPEAVVAGVPHWASDYSWAGLALGWIHRVVSLLVSMPYGNGKLTVTTFKLPAEQVQANPIAQALLAGMVDLSLR